MNERQELISRQLQNITRPWVSVNLPIPNISVKEIARSTQISSDGVISEISSGQIIIKDGEGNLKIGISEPLESGFKKANQEAGYRSKKPGGLGPVVRRRIGKKPLEKALKQSKKERSVLTFTPFSEEQKRLNERSEIKDRVTNRWMAKFSKPNTEAEVETQAIRSQVSFLQQIGLWDTKEKQGRLSFRLSEDVLELGKKEQEEMIEICQLLFSPGGYLDGSINLFQWALSGQKDNAVKNEIADILSQGISRFESDILISTRMSVPTIARLDLLLSVGAPTSFQIVEIEGDKTHAFGYVSITDFFREKQLGRTDTRGLISVFKEELVNRDLAPGNPVLLVVGKDESFYLDELQVFAKMAKSEGLNLITAPEEKVFIQGGMVKTQFEGLEVSTNIVINIPKTSSGTHNPDLGAQMMQLFTENKIVALIPPARFLGSKGLLGLVSNGDNDQVLERILGRFFDPQILARLRTFIPPTAVIRKANGINLFQQLKGSPKEFVVKRTMASGMKGVALPQNGGRQAMFIKEAIRKPNTFVLQRKTNQEQRVFTYFSPKEMRQESAPMFMRVSLFASKNGIATVGVTARETPDVHGAKDAIQLPVIFNHD